MIQDKLKKFLEENKKYTIFSHGKDSPLFKFVHNNESLNNLRTLKNILTKNDNLKMMFMGVALSVCFSNFLQEGINKFEHQLTMSSIAIQKIFTNNVPEITIIKGLETEIKIGRCPVTLEKDRVSNKFTNVTIHKNSDIEDPYCIDNTEDIETLEKIDFNFKKPAEQFAHYYNDKYKNKIPTQQEMNEIGNYYGVPENVLYFMAFKESRFDLNAKSAKNAKGLIGFMDVTAKEFGLIKVNSKGKVYQNHLKNGYASIDTAARLLMWLNHYINGKDADLNDFTKDKQGYTNLDYALAAYNAGIGNVYDFDTKKKTIPMYRETRNYIRDIFALSNGNAIISKKGHDFEVISATYDISKEAIDRFNPHLSQDKNIPKGSIVILPTQEQISKPIQVIVPKGSTVQQIADKYNTTPENIFNANQDNKYLKRGKWIAGIIIKIPTNDLPEYKEIFSKPKLNKVKTTSS